MVIRSRMQLLVISSVQEVDDYVVMVSAHVAFFASSAALTLVASLMSVSRSAAAP